jgi:hypothetical protein
MIYGRMILERVFESVPTSWNNNLFDFSALTSKHVEPNIK